MRRIALFLLVCAACFGQGSNTVFQTLANNTQTLGPTSVVQNIGQSQHVVNFRLTNAPSHSCNSPQTVALWLEGSYDNTNWTRLSGAATGGSTITSMVLDLNNLVQKQIFVTGAMPYVRANLNSFDNTNCQMTVNYTGTLYPMTSDVSPVVQYQMWQNVSGSNTTGVLPNVGQNQHRAVVFCGTSPAQGTIDAYFQGSFDNTNWFEMGSPETGFIADRNGAYWVVVEADGAVPYIRFQFAMVSATCGGSAAWYTGSIYPNAEQAAMAPRAANRGMHYKSIQTSTSGDNTWVSALSASRFICLYGIQVFNGAATANIVGIKDSGTGVFLTFPFPAAQMQPATIGPSPLAFFCLGRGDNLIINLSAATLVSGTVQYRYEDNPQ